ncbi:SRPBCC family protein [Actinoplanes sp. LDG1-06]|uniref:SRPBCC family protein n=1 Tax=Paractinoplanes ovalisporus TaxID=2810368 RepID=A0ABS2ASY4_9ACTN|nr:SRPBCC family protein [Actinoplanes ovalisporus]MBM2622982.1 SRPBCC family protein [Actinoplanes ovalisporus]
MIVVERTLAVRVAPGPTLGYLTDFGNTASWDPAVRQTVRTGAGPIRPGSTWRQVCQFLGITTELTWMLVGAEAGRLMFHGRNEGATCVDTVVVRAAPTGSEVTYRVELEMHGLAKLASPLIKMEFEKLGTVGAAALTGALNRLDGRATELQFPTAPASFPTAQGQEA